MTRDSVRVPRWLTAAHSVVLGGGYLLGPDNWSAGGSFAVIRELMPVRIWGAGFVLAGLLLLAQRRILGHALAAFASTFWGIGLAVTLFTGDASFWGGPAHTLLIIAPLHVLALWQRSHDRLAAGSDRSR